MPDIAGTWPCQCKVTPVASSDVRWRDRRHTTQHERASGQSVLGPFPHRLRSRRSSAAGAKRREEQQEASRWWCVIVGRVSYQPKTTIDEEGSSTLVAAAAPPSHQLLQEQ